MARAKRGSKVYTGDLYFRSWQLQSQFRQLSNSPNNQHVENSFVSTMTKNRIPFLKLATTNPKRKKKKKSLHIWLPRKFYVSASASGSRVSIYIQNGDLVSSHVKNFQFSPKKKKRFQVFFFFFIGTLYSYNMLAGERNLQSVFQESMGLKVMWQLSEPSLTSRGINGNVKLYNPEKSVCSISRGVRDNGLLVPSTTCRESKCFPNRWLVVLLLKRGRGGYSQS